MKSTVCVVIPVHKHKPSGYERISFEQCFRILGQHDIVVLSPQGLDLSEYKAVVPNFNVRFINPQWQSSLLNYNKLKLSRYFYRLFQQYQFLLTYELDAFVFRDELEYWCNKGYDYIGAPWFVGHDKPGEELSGVGNSGFSLRRVAAVKPLLQKMYLHSNLFVKQETKPVLDAVKQAALRLLSLGRENYSIQRFPSLFEDHFLCEVAAKKNPAFQIAPVQEAIGFAFETRPELLYQMNRQQLPMGCHAWWRYNLDFWKPHIEAFGYKL